MDLVHSIPVLDQLHKAAVSMGNLIVWRNTGKEAGRADFAKLKIQL
jgi:hypothetical protein